MGCVTYLQNHPELKTMKDLFSIIGDLESIEFQGSEKDEPEGSRYAIISETYIHELIKNLKEIDLSTVP